jgi:four helix bundle protein
MKFDHEKLEVYHISIEFLVLVDKAIKSIPKSKFYLLDQIQRASSSISLNIAEGAGEFSKKEKARFYRIAKRSATECAAILDVGLRLKVIDQEIHDEGRAKLISIVSILTKLAKNVKT